MRGLIGERPFLGIGSRLLCSFGDRGIHHVCIHREKMNIWDRDYGCMHRNYCLESKLRMAFLQHKLWYLHGAENLGAQGRDTQGSHDSYGQGVFLGTMILVVEHHHAYCGSV